MRVRILDSIHYMSRVYFIFSIRYPHDLCYRFERFVHIHRVYYDCRKDQTQFIHLVLRKRPAGSNTKKNAAQQTVIISVLADKSE